MAIEEPLNELLAHLREAIDRSEDGTGDRAELARLAGEVDRRLKEDDDEGLVQDLRHEATRFEANHPQLAAAITRAVDALGALGL